MKQFLKRYKKEPNTQSRIIQPEGHSALNQDTDEKKIERYIQSTDELNQELLEELAYYNQKIANQLVEHNKKTLTSLHDSLKEQQHIYTSLKIRINQKKRELENIHKIKIDQETIHQLSEQIENQKQILDTYHDQEDYLKESVKKLTLQLKEDESFRLLKREEFKKERDQVQENINKQITEYQQEQHHTSQRLKEKLKEKEEDFYKELTKKQEEATQILQKEKEDIEKKQGQIDILNKQINIFPTILEKKLKEQEQCVKKEYEEKYTTLLSKSTQKRIEEVDMYMRKLEEKEKLIQALQNNSKKMIIQAVETIRHTPKEKNRIIQS